MARVVSMDKKISQTLFTLEYSSILRIKMMARKVTINAQSFMYFFAFII